MREGLQITAVEHYKMLLDWIHVLPTFGSLEVALRIMPPQQGHQISFCVYRPGAFEVHRAWWNKDQLTSQKDFTILLLDLNRWRERAILELGEQQLEQLNLDHLNTVCNGNIKLVESALQDTMVKSSNTTDVKDGNSSP